MTDSQLVSSLYAAVLARNQREVYPFRDVFEACRTTRAEHRELLQEHAEIRAQVGVILHEYVDEKFRASEGGEAADSPSPYNAVKGRLVNLNNKFTASARRDSDIFQARMELSDKIKEKNSEIESKAKAIGSLEEQNAGLQGEAARLRAALAEQEAATAAIVAELESVRGLIAAAEARTRQLENENQDLYARFLTEKQKMASELNEMNNVVDGMKGFVGGGVSFLKNLKSSILPSAPAKNQPDAAAEAEDEFEIVGEVAADRASISGALSVAMEGVPSGMVARPSGQEAGAAGDLAEPEPPPEVITNYGPPREPAWIEKCHVTEINDACIDGRFVVTAGSDSMVKVYSLSSREMVHSFMSTGPSLSVDVVDEEWVISACAAGRSECRIWSLKTGRQRVNFGGHSNKILCARFIGANKVVTASADRSLKIWDISRTSCNPIRTITTNSSTESVGISADWNTMASGHQDGGVRIWDVSTGDKINFMPKVHNNHVLCLQYHPRDGYTLLASSRDANSIKLIDCRSYEEIKNLRLPGGKKLGSTRVCFSPDGTMVAGGTTDGSIIVWNVGEGSIQCTVEGGTDRSGHASTVGISSVDWSVAGLLSADRSGAVVQWRS